MSLNHSKSEEARTGHAAINLTVVRRKVRRLHPGRHEHDSHGPEGHPVESAHGEKPSDDDDHYTTKIPAKPLTIAFAAQRWTAGIKYLCSSVIALGTAAFLAFEISRTPSLRVQITIVTVICALFSLGLLH